MARSGKLATLQSRDEVARWLAEAIQEKAAKENAGLVEITLTESGRALSEPEIRLSTNMGRRGFALIVCATKREHIPSIADQ